MTSSHFHHAYLLQVHHQSAWSTANPELMRLHLLPEEEQGHNPFLKLEMYNKKGDALLVDHGGGLAQRI